MQKPTAGLPDTRAHPATGDAGPLDGNPATPTRGTAPRPTRVVRCRSLSRTLRLAPRPETAIRRPGAHPVRSAARGIRRPGLRGAIPGQLALVRRPARRACAMPPWASSTRSADRSGPSRSSSPSSSSSRSSPPRSPPRERRSVGGHRRPRRRRRGSPSARRRRPGRRRRVGSGRRRRDHRPPASPGSSGAVPSAAPGDAPGPDAPSVQVPAPADQGAFLADGTLLKPIAVDTTIPDATADVTRYKVKAGDTLTGIARQVRRHDDDHLVGEQPQEQEHAQAGQDAHHPARRRTPRDGQGGPDRSTGSARDVRRRLRSGSGSPTTSPTTTIYIGQTLFVPERPGRPDRHADPAAQAEARSPADGGSGGRGGPVLTRPSGPVRYAGGRFVVAGRRRRQLHQPVLPLRPLGDRHRRRLRVARRRRRGRDRRSSPAGRATAAATRSGSPTAPGCTRRTTTCRASRSGPASPSARPAHRRASASPGTRPGRTSTSRSGSASRGRAATA